MDEAKKELVRGWLTRASHDLAAGRVLGASRAPLRDVAVYHCQQAAEKAHKAYLVFHDRRVEKTHDLRLLVERAAEIEPGFSTRLDAADRLAPYATMYRYPGVEEQPDEGDFEGAVGDASRLYQQVLTYFPPDVHPDDDPSGSFS